MRRTIGYALCAVALLLGVWLSVAGAGEAKEKPAIEQILDILLQRGQITPEEYRSLQEKVKQEQAAGVKEPSAAVLAGIEKGRPFLKSADDNFRIELGGRLQVDFDAAEDGTRTLTGQFLSSQFLIRRARIDVDAIFYKWIRAKIQSELTEGNNSSTQVSLKDAYIDLTFMPELRFRAGQFHVPFSLEEYGTSDNFIDFIERSMVNNLTPMRDRGVKIYGDLGLMDGVITYNLGGFNGTGEDTSDNNSGKDLAFRLEYSPFRNSKSFWLKGLQFAGNVTWGDEDNLNTASGQTIARTPNRFTFFASQSAQGQRTRYGGDFAWWVGPASLKFEYDVQTNQRNGLGPGGTNLDDVTATGWYVSSTWVVTGEDKQRSGNVIPDRPFIPFFDQSGLGAVEIGARFAQLKFDSDSPVNLFSSSLSPVNIPGGGTSAKNGAKSLTMGVNWYFNEWTRAMLNWNYYWFDNALGTPFSCQLGSCSAAQLRGADKESWEILSRLQIWF
jgi:phosphate-selective porin OprO and OprP